MLSENLRQIRNEKKLSRLDLSKKSGITVRTINYIESGENNNPKICTLERLADALDVSITKLLDLD